MATCNGIPSSPLIFSPNFILQTHNPHDHEHGDPHMTLTPLLPPCSSPHDLSSSRRMMELMGRRSVSFAGNAEACEAEDEISDVDCSKLGDRKRRLNLEQVRALEKNFELGNKLEPERKMQLARSLGLEPRQIAIWFQNRRARWKTKQLEKDFDLLKRQFDAVKSDNDALRSQNKKLQAEIQALKGRDAPELINLNKETEGSCSNRSENSSEISRTLADGPTESNLNPIQSQPFFTAIRPPSISQFLHGSSRTELQCPKIENGVGADENFSNLLCGMEDQNAFWAWPDHHNFH